MNDPSKHSKVYDELVSFEGEHGVRKSNASVSSEISFKRQNQKRKAKSFNRQVRMAASESEHPLVKIYKELEYSNDFKRILRRFFNNYEKQKIYRLAVSELRVACEKQLKRVRHIKTNNQQLANYLMEQNIHQTDNQLSMVAISNQIKVMVDMNSSSNGSTGNYSIIGYEKVLLDVERSDQKINNFIDTCLKLQDPSQLNIGYCKQFFRKEINEIKNCNDRILRSRKKLFEIIYFMCRVLEGETLAFDEVYETQEEMILEQLEEGENEVHVTHVATTKTKEVRVTNLDQSMDELEYEEKGSRNNSQRLAQSQSHQSRKSVNQKHQAHHQGYEANYTEDGYEEYEAQGAHGAHGSQYGQEGYHANGGKQAHRSFNSHQVHQSHHNDWKDLSSKDLGLKISELSAICEQIPQLQSFVRTLKFSKITLQNRESFFKIVKVLIALHNRVGYLGRNKPTLMRQIETISEQLEEIYESIHKFAEDFEKDLPCFTPIKFDLSKEEDSTNQMTQVFSFMRKDITQISNMVLSQDRLNSELQQRITSIKTIVRRYWESITKGQLQRWDEYSRKHTGNSESEQECQIILELNECLGFMEIQNANVHKNKSEDQTSKSLQAQVNILLADYERLKGYNQEIQMKLSVMVEEKDEMQMDIEERDKMILNLTNLKLKNQKKERGLIKQLQMSHGDRENLQNMIASLEAELERISIEHQNSHKDLAYEHQDEIKQLVDKIAELERSKMDLLKKYQQECMKSIQNLHGSDMTNIELQNLSDRLGKKSKEFEEHQTRSKQTVSGLQKLVQELKNEKQLLDGQLDYSEKNKNRLMEKLDEVNSKCSEGVKDIEEKYNDELSVMRENGYKLQSELDRFRRVEARLNDEIENLTLELNQQAKQNGEYRGKLSDLTGLQNQYDTLGGQYERILEKLQKLENAHQLSKQKCSELTIKLQQIQETLIDKTDRIKKMEKKIRELENELNEYSSLNETTDKENQSLQKANRSLQKKLDEQQLQTENLRQSLNEKDRSHTATISKAEQRRQELQLQSERDIENLRQKLKLVGREKQKNLKQIQELQKKNQQHLSEYEVKYKEFDKLKKQYEKRQSEADIKIQQLEEEAENNEVFMKELRAQSREWQSKYTMLENHYREQKVSVEQLERDIANLRKMLREKERQLEQNVDEFESLRQNGGGNVPKGEHQSSLEKQYEELREKLNGLSADKENELNLIREQVLVEKQTVIQQNSQLQEKNYDLEAQIETLRKLNLELEKNVHNLHENIKEEEEHVSRETKASKDKENHLFSQYSLETDKVDQLLKKLEHLNQNLREKDNEVFTLEEKGKTLEKSSKQLKRKVSNYESDLEAMNNELMKSKNKIKVQQGNIQQLNEQFHEGRKREDNNKHLISELQADIQRLKKQNERKLFILKKEKTEQDQYYQSSIGNLNNQHRLQLQNAIKRAQKEASNYFNQLLIKEKENINSLSIQKMEELAEMKRKYQKVIREDRDSKLLLEDELNDIIREFSEYKKKETIQNSRVIIPDPNKDLELLEAQIHELRQDFDTSKRENNRLGHENIRLQRQLNETANEHSKLLTKHLELEHVHTLLEAKCNQMKLNLESSQRNLQSLSTLERDKAALERDLEKIRNKLLSSEHIEKDLRDKIIELQKQNNNIRQRYSLSQNQEVEKNSEWNQMKERERLSLINLAELNQRILQLQSQINSKEKKLRQRDQQLHDKIAQEENHMKQCQSRDRNMRQLENEFMRVKFILQEEKKGWTEMELGLKHEIESLSRRNREMQMERQTGMKTSHQVNQLTLQLKNLTVEYEMLKDRYQALEKYLNESQKVKIDLESMNYNLTKEIEDLKNERDISSQNIDNLRKELQVLKSECMNSRSDYQQLALNNKRLESEIQILRNKSNKSSQLQEELRKMKNFYTQEMKNRENALRNSFDQERKGVMEECDSVLKDLNDSLSRESNKNKDLQNQLNKLKRQNEDYQRALNGLRAQNMHISDDIQKLQHKIRDLEGQKKHYQGKISGEQGKTSGLQKQKQRLEADRRSSQLQNGRLQSEIRRLTQQLQIQRQVSKDQRQRLEEEIPRLKKLLENEKSEREALHRQINELTSKMTQLQSKNRNLQQEKLLTSSNQNQRGQQLDRLRAQLALTRQELVRVDEVITVKTKQCDSDMDRINQELQILRRQLSVKHQELSRVNEINLQYPKQLEANQSQSGQQIAKLRGELAVTRQELVRVNEVITVKTKQYEADTNRKNQELEALRRQLANVNEINSQYSKQLDANQGQSGQQIAKLRGELAVTRQELLSINGVYSNLQTEKNQLREQFQRKNLEMQNLVRLLYERDASIQELAQQLNGAQEHIKKIEQEIFGQKEKINNLNTERQSIQLSENQFKEEGIKLQDELARLRAENALLKSQYQRLNAENQKDKKQQLDGERLRFKGEMDGKDRAIQQVQQMMEKAQPQLDKALNEKKQVSSRLAEITRSKQETERSLHEKDRQLQTLRTQLSSLQIELKKSQEAAQHQQQHQLQHPTAQQTNLTHSRSSKAIVSYSYQGGQVSHAQLIRLEQEIRRLLKELEIRKKTIEKDKNQINEHIKEIKNLREQIQLLSQGKTISIKGYTRITNQNDMSLNTKGVVYTEYDVREMKARIEHLEQTMTRYQNRETELIREVEKFQFRERGYLEQIKLINHQYKSSKNLHQNSSEGEPYNSTIPNSLTKKTSLGQSSDKVNYPQSSTYRLQAGIETLQQNINMVGNEQSFSKKLEGKQLKIIIQRITNSNALMGSKVDQILQSSKAISSKDSLENQLVSDKNLSKELLNQIRQLIHQNKALIETLRDLKQYRSDINILLHAYIDPELITEYVFRILKYFSQVEDKSQQAIQIRAQLENIRANNVGGFYFTVLQEYTKFILENNSIEIYKHELRQRAKELLNFKEKFQQLIDSKLQGNQKLLKKSDSRNSLMSKSRSKYISNSQVMYEHSEVEKEDRYLDDKFMSSNQNSLDPSLVTATQKQRANSTITYTPYNQSLDGSRARDMIESDSIKQGGNSSNNNRMMKEGDDYSSHRIMYNNYSNLSSGNGNTNTSFTERKLGSDSFVKQSPNESKMSYFQKK